MAYEDGKLMLNENNQIPETKKPKMKELCSIQGNAIAKTSKLR